MKRKTLLIALALITPGMAMIGCGGMTDTRTLAEEPVGAEYDTVPDTNMKAAEPAPDDLVDAVYAEAMEQASPAPVRPPMDGEAGQPLEPAEDAMPSRPETLTYYFASDDASVRQKDFEQLTAHAAYLMKHPKVSLRIQGHTDQSGSLEYNRWLARKRAESVARILVEYGVDPSRIEIESLGEAQPIAGLQHAEADRRVELEYVDETRLSEASSF